jgi:hypothetical protein
MLFRPTYSQADAGIIQPTVPAVSFADFLNTSLGEVLIAAITGMLGTLASR